MTDRKPLGGYNPDSIGGLSWQRGRDAFDAGDPSPQGWPFLANRGWYERKKEVENENNL